MQITLVDLLTPFDVELNCNLQVEAGKKLLSSFDEKLSEYTMRTFKHRRIDVRTGVAVKEVQRHEVLLSDGSKIPFGLGSLCN